jgi:4,5-DOPA dioxygenase extradiol
MNSPDSSAALPTLFISHGSPTMVIDQIPVHFFLEDLSKKLPAPDAIVCISAHWQEPTLRVQAMDRPETIYDFWGFPTELYRLKYPAPGHPELAHEIVRLLASSGVTAALDQQRGLDHGAWVPLSLMYPGADIPVLQVSLLTKEGAQAHYELGLALQPLREKNVLIIASGGATHNLRDFGYYGMEAPVQDYARKFDDWLLLSVESNQRDELLAWAEQAPEARHNHPTAEHFLPFFVALGAAGEDRIGKRIHASFVYGILSMAAYAW